MKQFTLLALILLAGCEKPTNEAVDLHNLPDTEKVWGVTVCFQIKDAKSEQTTLDLLWNESDGGMRPLARATRDPKAGWYCADLDVTNTLGQWGQGLVRVRPSDLEDLDGEINHMRFLSTNSLNGTPHGWPDGMWTSDTHSYRYARPDKTSGFYIHPIARDDNWAPDTSLVIHPRRR